jgi:hypothetical protein
MLIKDDIIISSLITIVLVKDMSIRINIKLKLFLIYAKDFDRTLIQKRHIHSITIPSLKLFTLYETLSYSGRLFHHVSKGHIVQYFPTGFTLVPVILLVFRILFYFLFPATHSCSILLSSLRQLILSLAGTLSFSLLASENCPRPSS